MKYKDIKENEEVLALIAKIIVKLVLVLVDLLEHFHRL